MSFESDDVNASRLVRKNLYRPEVCNGSTGLTHRGGPLLEDFGQQGGGLCGPASVSYAALCDQAMYDYDNGDVNAMRPYCVVREWHRRERADRGLAPLSATVYVKRPPAPLPDRPQDFDVFAGGASLHTVAATFSADGRIQIDADKAIDLPACPLG